MYVVESAYGAYMAQQRNVLSMSLQYVLQREHRNANRGMFVLTVLISDCLHIVHQPETEGVVLYICTVHTYIRTYYCIREYVLN